MGSRSHIGLRHIFCRTGNHFHIDHSARCPTVNRHISQHRGLFLVDRHSYRRCRFCPLRSDSHIGHNDRCLSLHPHIFRYKSVVRQGIHKCRCCTFGFQDMGCHTFHSGLSRTSNRYIVIGSNSTKIPLGNNGLHCTIHPFCRTTRKRCSGLYFAEDLHIDRHNKSPVWRNHFGRLHSDRCYP